MIGIDLTGSVVLVAGASGGIGFGIADRFAEAGATVVRHGFRTASTVDVTADLAGDPAGAAVVVDTVIARHGRLDAVVNAAGLQGVATLADVSEDEWRATLDANVTAAHRLTRALAAHLAARGTGGAIVHLASIEGHHPAPAHGHYAVSKAALLMYAKAAATEFGPIGLRVNTVSPGLIDRPGLDADWPEGVARWRAASPLGCLGTPRDVADACLFLCCGLASWITGTDLAVDGGVLAGSAW